MNSLTRPRTRRRWPLSVREHLSLRYRRRKNRGAQFVVVDTPEGQLRLVNWHLGLRELERRWQVTHLLHHPSFTHSGRLPTLVVGVVSLPVLRHLAPDPEPESA